MDCLRDKWGRTTTLHLQLRYWMTTTDTNSQTMVLVCRFIYCFLFCFELFRNLHVFCCPCLFILFLPGPIFFSTFWISTRRNTLVTSVLVTGTLFFIKSLFKVFKLIHQIYIKRMIYNKNPIVFGPLSIKKYQLHKLVNNEVLDYRLS